MITSTISETRPITILIKEKDLIPVKAILNFLSDKYLNFRVDKFRTGKIGEDILVSFQVSDEFYRKVLEKFAYNDIPIIMKDQNALDFIDSKKEQKRRKLRAQGWSEIIKTNKQLTLKELKKLINKGKVKEVIREAKGGIRSNQEIVTKARKSLSETIYIAIDNLVSYSEENNRKTQEVIDQLILIAGDKDLKLFHKNEEMTQAGLTAINLSCSNGKYYHNLISIANNTKLSNFSNIKAAIALAELVYSSSDEEISIMDDIMKSLNLRWLNITLETISHKLSSEETDLISNFLNLIASKRITK